MNRYVAATVVWLFLASLATAEAPTAPGADQETIEVLRVEAVPSGLIRERELAELLELELPGPWDDARVALTRENIERTGRFSTVDISARPVEGGVVLVIGLRPKPWARHIVFSGRRQVDVERLLGAIKLRYFAVIEEGAVAEAAADIAAFYQREGHPQPEVVASSSVLADDGATELRFEITETPQPELAGFELTLTGNGSWYQDLLVRSSAAWNHFGMRLRGANQVRLERTADRLQRRLRRLGYAEARAEAVSTDEAAGRHLALRVDYGRRTRIKGRDLGRGVLDEVTESWRARPRPLNERAVERFVRSAAAAIRERGYLDAEVSPEIAESQEQVRVLLEARRGVRSWVERVEFEGNSALDDDQLREALTIGPPRWLGLVRSRPGPERLSDNARVIEALYASLGFPYAAVDVSLDDATGGPRVVRFTVDEGLRVRVRSVELRGVDRLREARVRDLFGVDVGDPWSQVAADKGVLAVSEAYRSEGFGQATVRVQPVAVEADGAVAVVVEIDEGAQTVLGPTIVRGAFKTHPEIVQRLNRKRRGDAFELEELAHLQRRLYRTSAFESVTIAAGDREHAPAGETAAVVSIREDLTGYYEFGADFNSDRGFELVGSVGNRNLLHRALSVSVGALLGQERGALTLNLSQPLTFGVPVTSFVRAGGLDDRTNPGFAERRVGVEFGVDREFSEELHFSLSYRLERHAPYDIEPDVDETLLPETKRVGALNPVLTWEGRDDPFNASRGGFVAVRLKSSRSALGAAVAFDRLELDGRIYRSLSESVVLAAALRLGVAEPRGGDSVPLTERFFIGGASSHRGFREKELGPKGEDGSPLGGESFALGNLELRFRVWGVLDAGVFADVGNVYFSGYPGRDVRWALGGGLRLRTPVGPVRVDVGYLLDAGVGEESTVVHFALGHAF